MLIISQQNLVMTILLRSLLIITTSITLLSCLPKDQWQQDTSTQAHSQNISKKMSVKYDLAKIIILNTSLAPLKTNLPTEQLQELENGASELNQLIKHRFKGNQKFHSLSYIEEEGLAGSFRGSSLAKSRFVGMQAESDAIIMSQLTRYNKLIGNKYGADQPAEIAFSYHLIHLETGSVLCQNSYREKQQTLAENILSLPKAVGRGFKFVSPHDLLKEGVEVIFNDCPYLNDK